jgi:hypothetical protein
MIEIIKLRDFTPQFTVDKTQTYRFITHTTHR